MSLEEDAVTWYCVWDDINEDMESAWGVEADSPEDAAERYMAHGEENSWWVGGDEYPTELMVLEHAGDLEREVLHKVEVVTDWDPTFTAYQQEPIGCALPPELASRRAMDKLLEASQPQGRMES